MSCVPAFNELPGTFKHNPLFWAMTWYPAPEGAKVQIDSLCPVQGVCTMSAPALVLALATLTHRPLLAAVIVDVAWDRACEGGASQIALNVHKAQKKRLYAARLEQTTLKPLGYSIYMVRRNANTDVGLF